MKGEGLGTALGRCRAQIASHLHGAFAAPSLVHKVLASYDRLVSELEERPRSALTLAEAAVGDRRLGSVRATYAQVVAAFGEPRPGDGANIDAFWLVAAPFEGFATIYNWKNGHAYHGERGLAVESIGEWEVGGSCLKSLEFVRDRLGLF